VRGDGVKAIGKMTVDGFFGLREGNVVYYNPEEVSFSDLVERIGCKNLLPAPLHVGSVTNLVDVSLPTPAVVGGDCIELILDIAEGKSVDVSFGDMPGGWALVGGGDRKLVKCEGETIIHVQTVETVRKGSKAKTLEQVLKLVLKESLSETSVEISVPVSIGQSRGVVSEPGVSHEETKRREAHASAGKHLFILSGQSNMVGLRPEATFTPALHDAFGQDSVIVVKDAKGAQPIKQWYKNWKPTGESEIPEGNGILYDRLMSKVEAQIKEQNIQTVTFVWMQGERDTSIQQGEVYKASLLGLLDQLREDLGRKDLNFVIGRLSDARNKHAHWMMIRKAQVEVAEGHLRGAWVNTDDLNGEGNKVHYGREGYSKLGQRFAEKAIQLINNPPAEE